MPAWTTPRDWTTAELVTEAMMDTHVKDNSNALHNMTIVRRTTAMGTSSYVTITWEAEDLDEGGLWAVGAPTRFTAPHAGRWEIHVVGTMTTATGTGEHGYRVQRFNSGSVLQETWGANTHPRLNESISCYGAGQMSSGDYLEVALLAGSSGVAPAVTSRAVVIQRG